jgi:predicted RND superfamily exporter protein
VKTVVGADGSFTSPPLVPDPVPDDAEGLALIRQRAHDNPIIADQLLSAASDAALMSVRLASDVNDAEQAEAVAELRRILAETSEKHPGLVFHALGDPVVGADTASYQLRDLQRFIPIVYVSIAVLLWLFLRRVRGMGVVLAAATVSLAVAMGILSAIGGTVNNASVLLPPLILALAVASTMHFVVEYAKNALERPAVPSSTTTLIEVLPPAFMAALTTAVGFGSLLTSRVPAVHEFGIAAGLAMLAVIVIGVLFVALGMHRYRPDQMVSEKGIALAPVFDGLLKRLAELLVRRHRLLFFGSLAIAAVMAAGIPRIVVDQSSIEFFAPGTPIREANTFINDKLGGSTVFVASIRTEEDDRFFHPEELKKLLALEDFMRKELGAQAVVSIADYLELMNQGFNDGRREEYKVPDTTQQVAQLMLLNGDSTVHEYLDEPHRWARVVARSNQLHSRETYDMHQRVERYLAEHFPQSEGYVTHSTGQSRLWANLFWDLISSQVVSLGLSTVLIFALMFLMFRSAVTGAYSVVPNIFPIVFTFGVMGWFDIPLDTATVMTATVTLGIAVDDTIHSLQFMRVYLANGGEIVGAVRQMLHHKGPAMIATSVVISLGFVVLLFASFVPTRNFGILTAIAMVSALFGDIILLPAMLLTTKTRLGLSAPTTPLPASAPAAE